MNEDRKPVSPYVGAHPAPGSGVAGAGSANLLDTIPEPLHAVTTRRIQSPTLTDSPGISVPVHVLPVIMKNNVALAPKPQSPPPHPTVAQVLTPIPLGFQMAYKQLTSPTPYSNVISAYKIYRNKNANSFSGSTLWETRPHDNAINQKVVTVQDSSAGANQSWYYFASSVDTTGQESTPVAFQAGAVISASVTPNIHSAVGSTSQPSTTSISYAVIPEMAITLTTKGGNVEITFTASLQVNQSTTLQGYFAIFRDGSQLTPDYIVQSAQASGSISTVMLGGITWLDAPTAASHTYDIRWKVDSGLTLVARGTARSLQVVELG